MKYSIELSAQTDVIRQIKIRKSSNAEFVSEVANILIPIVETTNISDSYNTICHELNIVKIVEIANEFGCDVSPEIQEMYDCITKQLTSEPLFDIQNSVSSTMTRIRSALKDELGDEYENPLLLNDRKLRYQYTNPPKIEINSLTEKIATRARPKVFVSRTHPLPELLSTLHGLKRLPVLIILDHVVSTQENIEIIRSIKDAVDELGLKNISCYFNNTPKGNECKVLTNTAKFLGFTAKYGSDTDVAVIFNGLHMPKFLIGADHRPMSVINFGSSIKNNRATVYCKGLDLIIYYSHNLPVNYNVQIL